MWSLYIGGLYICRFNNMESIYPWVSVKYGLYIQVVFKVGLTVIRTYQQFKTINVCLWHIGTVQNSTTVLSFWPLYPISLHKVPVVVRINLDMQYNGNDRLSWACISENGAQVTILRCAQNYELIQILLGLWNNIEKQRGIPARLLGGKLGAPLATSLDHQQQCQWVHPLASQPPHHSLLPGAASAPCIFPLRSMPASHWERLPCLDVNRSSKSQAGPTLLKVLLQDWQRRSEASSTGIRWNADFVLVEAAQRHTGGNRRHSFCNSFACSVKLGANFCEISRLFWDMEH